MSVRVRAFFSSQNLSFEGALHCFYCFMQEAKSISHFFQHCYTTADSLAEALQNPFPDKENDFFEKFKKQIDVVQIGDDTVTSFELGSNIDEIKEFLSLQFTHSAINNSSLSFTFVRTTKDWATQEQQNINKIIAAIVDNFPVQYIVDVFVSDGALWNNLKLTIGGGITAPTEEIGRIKNFPSHEIAPGFTRVASVEEVFDVTNPVHVEKAKALEAEILSNSGFVNKTRFFTPRKN